MRFGRCRVLEQVVDWDMEAEGNFQRKKIRRVTVGVFGGPWV